jgi:hypothetical protein
VATERQQEAPDDRRRAQHRIARLSLSLRWSAAGPRVAEPPPPRTRLRPRAMARLRLADRPSCTRRRRPTADAPVPTPSGSARFFCRRGRP